jgi:hydroxyacylglutathione hydrolase
MIFKQILTGGDRNFAYLIIDEDSKKAVVVDPSYDPESVYNLLIENSGKAEYLINTHRHGDHTNGNDEFEKLSGCKAIAYGDIEPKSGLKIVDNTTLPLGNLEVKILHTPGHTDDAICILVDDVLLTGDTIFVGKVGGTDFEDGARKQYASIHDKILKLDDNVRIYPGHDVGLTPSSSVVGERETNPFLLRKDFEAFVDLKINWLAYKEKHGLA